MNLSVSKMANHFAKILHERENLKWIKYNEKVNE